MGFGMNGMERLLGAKPLGQPAVDVITATIREALEEESMNVYT